MGYVSAGWDVELALWIFVLFCSQDPLTYETPNVDGENNATHGGT